MRAAGGQAVLTDPALPSGSDRVHAALAELDPAGGTTWWSTCRAISRPCDPAGCALVIRRWPTRRGHRHAGGADPRRGRGRDAVLRQGRLRLRARRDGRAGAVFLPPAHSVGRRAALAPCRHLCLSPGGAGPLRRAAAKPAGAAREAWSSCGRWRTGCGSPARAWSTARSGSIRRRTWSAPAPGWHRGRHEHERGHRLPGHPGRLFRPGLPHRLSGDDDPALPVLRGGDRGGAGGTRRSGHAAVREQPGRPGVRHPRAAAGLGLFIVGEQFQRVEHCLLGVPGATVGDIRRAHSHSVALGQVRRILRGAGPDAGGGGRHRRRGAACRAMGPQGGRGDRLVAGGARSTGCEILRANVEDAAHNTTRFYVVSPRPVIPDPATPDLMTTFVFRVRNVPAALYKALGGFATNGVNMTKLESYMLGGRVHGDAVPVRRRGPSRAAGPAPGAGGTVVLLHRDAGAGGLSDGGIPAGAGSEATTDGRHPGRDA